MSAVLLIVKDRKQMAKVPVTGNLLTVGRSAEQSEVVLDEPLAGRKHAEITFEKGVYWVRDLGSINGTLHNGKKLGEPRKQLSDGDEIVIGSSQIKFHLSESPDDEAPAGDEGATMAAPSMQAAKKSGARKPAARGAEADSLQVKVRILEGKYKELIGKETQDWAGTLAIGRKVKDNDLVLLEDELVSGCHARIVREAGEFVIEDLDSANGTFVNGIKAQRKRLADGDKVKVGSYTFVFELKDLRKQRRNLYFTLAGTVAVAGIALAVVLLRPPDLAGQFITTAREQISAGDLVKAVEAYQMALKIEPNRAEAKTGLARVTSEIKANEDVLAAEASAAVGNNEKAKELIVRVLQDFPTKERALQLNAVIESVENAESGMKARNWTGAIQSLEKVHDKYPKSELINARLKLAREEEAALASLVKARDALKHEQADAAEASLKSIAANSVYLTEAKQLLDGIERSRRGTGGFSKAKDAYREGRLAEALQEVDKAMVATPGRAELVALRARIRKVEAFDVALKEAEDLAQKPAAEVDELLRGRKSCDEVLNVEDDPLNVVRRRALEARAKIVQLLQGLAQANFDKAQDLLKDIPPTAGKSPEEFLKPAIREKIKQLKNVWVFLGAAVKADDSNPTTVQARSDVKKQIEKICQELYRHGSVLVEIGNENDQKTAQDCFSAIIEIGIPGEKYYELGKSKAK